MKPVSFPSSYHGGDGLSCFTKASSYKVIQMASSKKQQQPKVRFHFRSCFFPFTLTPIILIFHFLSLLFEAMKDCFFFNSFSRLKKNMKWVLLFRTNALGWNALFFCEFDKVTQFHCASNNFCFHYIPSLAC